MHRIIVIAVVLAISSGQNVYAQPTKAAVRSHLVHLTVTGSVESPNRQANGKSCTKTGTGFLISAVGHVITAGHLFLDTDCPVPGDGNKLNNITVRAIVGRENWDAYTFDTIISKNDVKFDPDPPRVLNPSSPPPDLALVRLPQRDSEDGSPLESYKPVHACSEGRASFPDEEVFYAFGYEGNGPLTAKSGSFDALINSVDLYKTQIQTGHGMSGGPVFRSDGMVIGIIRSGQKGEKYTWVTPISRAEKLLFGTGLALRQLIGCSSTFDQPVRTESNNSASETAIEASCGDEGDVLKKLAIMGGGAASPDQLVTDLIEYASKCPAHKPQIIRNAEATLYDGELLDYFYDNRTHIYPKWQSYINLNETDRDLIQKHATKLCELDHTPSCVARAVRELDYEYWNSETNKENAKNYIRFTGPSTPIAAANLFELACSMKDGVGCTAAGIIFHQSESRRLRNDAQALRFFDLGCRYGNLDGCVGAARMIKWHKVPSDLTYDDYLARVGDYDEEGFGSLKCHSLE